MLRLVVVQGREGRDPLQVLINPCQRCDKVAGHQQQTRQAGSQTPRGEHHAQQQSQRAEVIAALWCVDFVTVFDEPDPLALIELLKPDVLVKGEDWPEQEIVGADVVRKHGGKIVRAPSVPGISTSIIIERIRQRF